MPTLALIAILGAWLGFANPVLSLPPAALAFPLGLAWIGFRAFSPKRAFLWGWLAGTLACTGCLYWMVVPVSIYGNMPWYVALPCPLLAGGALGALYGLFSMGMHFSGRASARWPVILMAGLSWAALESLMSFILTGFPWITLSAAFAAWPLTVQAASLMGAFALSGVFAALAVSILLYRTVPGAQYIAVGIAVFLLGFGFWKTHSFADGGREVTVALAQGNVDQSMKWDPDYQQQTVDNYIDLSRQAAQQGAELIVWPETAMPFYLQDRTPYGFSVRQFAKDHDVRLLAGSPAYRVTDPKTRSYVLLNRAFLVKEDGSASTWYDKEHLVPFGEYMPLEELMPFEKLVQAAGNFVPGENTKSLTTQSGVDFGMLICYEAIFPDLAQKQVELGAQFLVNISNDAWFGKTSAPRQHLLLTTLRAIEQSRWIARCTNTGITVFIDPLGRINSRLPQFESSQLTGVIRARTATTAFHSIQPWLAAALLTTTFLGFAFVTVAVRRGKRQDS
ncbi:apolipoprotein N-acyltransferase [Salidesulfovibrio brasiliensis]|uniref:apolipoprotein N-acyltransferase n=1 Tax=Salidesulfovibrio brasiliensis TaxID=221711 RepID=UPI0006D085E6|nr:apolipoprotein N-acyltransferase [Salidesulfovibrio brasiliensis]